MSEFKLAKPKDYIEPLEGQESVWDYPESITVEASKRQLQVVFNNVTIANTQRGIRVLQRGIPPVYYFPPEDVLLEHLTKANHHTYCKYKGTADYWNILVANRTAKNAAWSYPDPIPNTSPKNYIAFYAHLVDSCYVDGGKATSPDWVWVGGWVTKEVVGPFLNQQSCNI